MRRNKVSRGIGTEAVQAARVEGDSKCSASLVTEAP